MYEAFTSVYESLILNEVLHCEEVYRSQNKKTNAVP